MSVELRLNIPGVWRHVRDARQQVAQAAAALPAELRAAAVMTTAELIENAIKYGESVPGCEDVQVVLKISAGQVVIEVANGIHNRSMLDELFERIEQIVSSTDRERLYLGRLEELLHDPSASGKLGLYRIGFEGQFDLSCDYNGQVLTVRATRNLA